MSIHVMTFQSEYTTTNVFSVGVKLRKCKHKRNSSVRVKCNKNTSKHDNHNSKYLKHLRT